MGGLYNTNALKFSSQNWSGHTPNKASISTVSLFLSGRNQKGTSANYDALPPVLVQTRDHLNPQGLDLNLGCKHSTANNNLLLLCCINNADVFEMDQGGIN